MHKQVLSRISNFKTSIFLPKVLPKEFPFAHQKLLLEIRLSPEVELVKLSLRCSTLSLGGWLSDFCLF